MINKKRNRSKYQTDYRRNKIEKLKILFGGKCSICGYDKCLDALDFHHVNPEDKSFSLREFRGRAYKTQLEEAKKCVLICSNFLICSNCHREIHYKKSKSEL